MVVKIIYYYEREYNTIYFYLQPALRASWGKIWLVTHVCGEYRILDTEFEKKLYNQCEQLLLDNYELIPDTTHHVTLTTRQLCQRINMSTLTQWPTCQQGQQGLDNHSYRRVTVICGHVQLHCTPLQEV